MKLPELTSTFKETHNLIHKSYLPKILLSAVQAGVFDTLSETGMSCDALAEQTGIRREVTPPLLDILHVSGYLDKDDDKFSLTPVAREFFVSTSPAFQGDYLDYMVTMSEKIDLAPQAEAEHTLKHDEETWVKKEAMLMMANMGKGGPLQECTSFVTSLPEFPRMRKMCDLAGSHGYYSMALLEQNPQLEGYLFDLPGVAAMAETIIEEAGYAGRLKAVGLDMRGEESFGEGYDLVFVSNFLYEWGTDERLGTFLSRVNRALNPGGVFVSRHMTLDVQGDDFLSQAILELITRAGDYPTHSLSEKVLTGALTEAGFSDFTILYPEETGYDNTLTVAARKQKAS